MLHRWLAEVLQTLNAGLSPRMRAQIPVRTRRRLFYAGLFPLGLALALAPAVSSATDISTAVSVKTRQVVAAGFGYQNAESSSITVKTYDAKTGEILSDETYELDVKDEGMPANQQPRERIFAGGVGVGADGLSEFNLRVYDAATGQFLWQGRLNLGVGGHGDGSVVQVKALVQPRALVQRIAQQTSGERQPYFLLRAVDLESGRLLWSDQFSADVNAVRTERIGRGIIGMEAGAPRDIDFRIRMFDEVNRTLLWEDKVEPETTADDVPSGGQEEAAILPGWPAPSTQPAAKESI